MSNQVFANMRELSCKAGKGKAVCAFPDVCFTPPAPPPSGLPVPYPNTGVDTDTSSGSRSVKISKKEVMLKNKSYFKKSVGDEAGSSPKKGVLTSVNRGKVFFNAWSMDVKFEGENVVRHLDLTTHNHASPPGNTPTWPFLSGMTPNTPDPCGTEKQKQKDDCDNVKNPCAGCSGKKPSGKKDSMEAADLADRTAGDKCLAAMRCILLPYNPNKCCKPQTGHHLVEASAFHDKGRGGKGSTRLKGITSYKEGAAPVVCAEGVNQYTGTHGLMHTYQSATAAKCPAGKLTLANGDQIDHKVTSYGEARDSGVKAFQKTFPQSKCSEKCLSAQLDGYHRKCGLQDNTPVKAVETGSANETAADIDVLNRTFRVNSAKVRGPARR